MRDVVLIVGGTTGIGLETAKYLSDNNRWKVIVCGRKSVNSSNFNSIKTDIRSKDAVQSLYDEVQNTYGDIHGLIYCAGITTEIKPIEQFDELCWNNIINTNVTGLLRVLKNFHQSLKATVGRVVVVNSIFLYLIAPFFRPDL